MRHVCPKDVKNMFLKQARSAYWKKLAACTSTKKRRKVYGSSQLRLCCGRKQRKSGLKKHRNVARKLGCGRRLGMSVNVKLARWRKAQKHRLYNCPEWHEVRREIPEAFRKWEQKARTSRKEWKWQRGIVTHPLSERQWNRGHFSLKKWESEKHKNWGMRAEGFKGHVATDGSLFWVPLESGEHVVCLWCSWIMMRRWGFCMGCLARWWQHLRSSAPSRGGS